MKSSTQDQAEGKFHKVKGKVKEIAGKLSDDGDRGGARKTGRKTRPSAPVHLLCPDRDTVDRYLVGLLNFFNSQPYKAAALFLSLIHI